MAAERGLLRSAHDCSHGGLGVTVAEVAMGGAYADAGFGLDLDLSRYGGTLDAASLLFSESGARAVVTTAPAQVSALVALCEDRGVPVHEAGRVRARDGVLRLVLRDTQVEHSVARLREVYFSAIPRRLGD